MPSRRHILTALGACGAAGLGLGGYGLLIEPGFRLRVRHYTPAPAAWPAGLRLRIGVIADLHAGGPHMGLRRVEAVVEAMNALRPDLVVFLGDLTASHRGVTERVPPAATATALGRLRSRLGTWAVLGNHDWWDDAASWHPGRGRPEVERALRAAGIPVLENDGPRLRLEGRPFWLLGLGSMWAFGGPMGQWRGIDDLPATLARLEGDDAPAILLAHEPDIFPLAPPRIALTLAGHTHGGQVRFLGWTRKVPSNHGNRYAYGHIVEAGRHLIVSGGLGNSLWPVRFGVPPEILLVELGGTAAKGGA